MLLVREDSSSLSLFLHSPALPEAVPTQLGHLQGKQYISLLNFTANIKLINNATNQCPNMAQISSTKPPPPPPPSAAWSVRVHIVLRIFPILEL